MSKLAASIFEDIEMEKLISVKGRPGLFHFDKVVSPQLMRVYSMGNDMYVNVPIKDSSFLKDFTIFTTKGEPSTPLKIFDRLSFIEEQDNKKLERLSKKDITKKFMKRVLEFHSDAFKDYHLAKIIGWYLDLNLFLTKVEDYENRD